MVMKRQRFVLKQRLLKFSFKKIELKLLILKSLFKNHYNDYIFR